MTQTHEADYRTVEEYLAPRTEDWTEYRERAISEGDKFLAAVDSALDVLRENRFVSEKEGRVPDSSVEAMIDTGLFRAFTPLQFGGLEMAPAAFFEGVMRIAEADSSAAWIAGPSAIGSENGRPSSMMSAPDSMARAMAASLRAMSGKPQLQKIIKAARPSALQRWKTWSILFMSFTFFCSAFQANSCLYLRTLSMSLSPLPERFTSSSSSFSLFFALAMA